MKGIRIRRFGAVSTVIAGGLSVLVLLLFLCGTHCMHRMSSTTERYFIAQQSAKKLQNGSDILTEQVRLYVMTGQAAYLEGYFQEANVIRSREAALAELREVSADTRITEQLEAALTESEALMAQEFYAMRLAAEGFGTAAEDLPREVAALSLSAEDAALDSDAQLAAARLLVFDGNYQRTKAEIAQNVRACTDDLLETAKADLHASASLFSALYISQEASFLLLVVFLIAYGLLVRKLVVDPLGRFRRSIAHDTPFPVSGAAELRSLAEAYNRVFAENKKTHELILYEAEHDELSGLLNHGSFKKRLALCQQQDAPFALLLCDIDDLKHINDTCGHAAGDAVIRRTARHLLETFRGSDYVFRVGGDEFAVLLPGAAFAQRESIRQKLLALRETLAAPEDGLPSITVSIGAAFSDRPRPQKDIFSDADRMLYDVKEQGKNGSRIYGE